MKNTHKFLLSFIFTLFTLSACATPPKTQVLPSPTRETPPPPTATSTLTPTATITPTPQPRITPQSYGIERNDFPSNYNPLTGRAVKDPSLLDLPAILVSISNNPESARPQAGIGFASWVFEYYIGEAATRFLGIFYGDYPRQIPNITGNCPVNDEIFEPRENWVGNRVWLDENENGIQDDWETGVGGICIHLYKNDERIASTSTNSNGYYAFNIPDIEKSYFIEFETTKNYTFTLQDIGNDDQDSDADVESGRTQVFSISSAETSVNLGLIPLNLPVAPPTPSADYIPTGAYVGPIRSGRLTYDHINKMFPQSCLVFAGAAPDIFAQLNPCEIVYGEDTSTPNSALLPVDQMRQLAEDNGNGKTPNYSGHLFNETQPNLQSEAATHLTIFYHQFNQSAWEYDPISQSYLHFTDNIDGTGILHSATDRLTGRQQSFENIIVLEATHDIFRHNQLDIDLRPGKEGFAHLFRDGKMIKIRWSTGNRAWEKESGLLRPIHFVDAEGNPIVFHPGKTWIHLVTPASSMEEVAEGKWQMRFAPPE